MLCDNEWHCTITHCIITHCILARCTITHFTITHRTITHCIITRILQLVTSHEHCDELCKAATICRIALQAPATDSTNVLAGVHWRDVVTPRV